MPAPARVFLVFLFAYFLSYFFRSANAVIAPDLSRDLSLSPAQLGFMTSLFYLTFAVVQIPLGGLLDRFGPRFVHPSLMLFGAAGSLIYANAHSFAALSLGRALLGVGMAAGLMASLKAFSLWFPKERFASVSSLFVALGGSGAIVASRPLVELNQALGWRGVFTWGALVIVLAALLVAALVRNAPAGNALPSSSQASSAQLWRTQALWRIGFLNFVLGGGFLAWQTLWGGDYLYKVREMAGLEVGNLLFVFSLSALFGFLLCGPLSERFGIGRLLLGGGVSFTAALALLAFWPWLPKPLLYLPYMVMGFTGAFNILGLSQARLLYPAGLTGRVVTAINFMGFIGTFLLQWGMGQVVGARGYPTAFLIWLVLLIMALAFYWPLAKPKSSGGTARPA